MSQASLALPLVLSLKPLGYRLLSCSIFAPLTAHLLLWTAGRQLQPMALQGHRQAWASRLPSNEPIGLVLYRPPHL